jgi:type IV pilus assembly protein PilQ
MNERIKKLIALGIFVLAAGICRGEQTDGVLEKLTAGVSDRITSEATAVGRDDPFAGAFGGVSAAPEPDVPASDGPVKSKPPLFVQTVTLKFLRAANLKAVLGKMSSEHGSIGVDDNTNSLIVCDINDNLSRILAEVKKADQTPSQVMIEVVIVDVQLRDDTEIGVDWDLLNTLNTEKNNVDYRQSMVYLNRSLYVEPTIDATTGLITNPATAYMTRPGGSKLGGELSIISGTIRNVVHLIQEKRKVDILASPRVMVVSGQKAEIKTIKEIPYTEVTQTSGGGGGTGAISSTQFKEVGVIMDVKATVTDDGKILLDVKPKQSVNTGTSIGGVPVIDTREASTTLLMDDGQVVVMGGLRRQETTTVINKVPLLGDLPLIGLLFSNKDKVVDNSELIVLLSPHVYKDEPVPADAMARYNEITGKSLLTLPVEPNSPPRLPVGRQERGSD